MSGDYPVTENYTYLNTASSGLISRPLYEQRRIWDNAFLHGASLFRNPIYEQIEVVRETVRDFIGAQNVELALVPNLSYGLNVLLEDASFHRSVLLIQDDYPSLVWPFISRSLSMQDSFPVDNWSLDHLLEHIDRTQPEAFAFSAVQYLSGRSIPPDWLVEIQKPFPELLLMMDSTQFIGTRPFSMAESGVDLLIGSGYKWIGAGYGNGYVAISDRLRDRLNPKSLGYNTTKQHELSDKLSFHNRLEPGHQATSAFLSLDYAIRELNRIGLESIWEQITRLHQYALEQLDQQGIEHTVDSENVSSIITIPGSPEEVGALAEQGVICSYRHGVRFSFHHYNGSEDIDRFCTTLASLR